MCREDIRFVVFVVGCVILIMQRLRFTETIRQRRWARHFVAQWMETEIEGAFDHRRFKLYHGPNVHTSNHDFMSFGLDRLICSDMRHRDFE